MKPFFTGDDFCSIGGNCPHKFTEDYHCSGLHEADKANTKVQPVLEENIRLKAWRHGMKVEIRVRDEINEELRERLAAAEEVAKWYSMLGQKMDEGLVLWDGGEKARAYFASHGEHFEKHGDKP